MKYLYSLVILSLCLFAACKSDSNTTKTSESVASSEIPTEKLEVGEKQEVKFTESLEVTVPAATEVDGVKTSTTEIVETKTEVNPVSTSEIKSKVTAQTKNVSTPEVTKVEAVKEEVKEVVNEDKEVVKEATEVVKEEVKDVVKDVKDATKESTSTPTKIIEPNLKVTVPIDHGSKPAVEQTYTEEVEKVDIKKNTKSNVPNKPGAMNIDHSLFNKLLRNNVSNTGVVDYKAIKANATELEAYLTLLSKADITSLSKSAQLAFWINAYNAFTIKKVISNYPLNSIKDLNGGKPWDDKWINIDNRTLSLNDIENKIIRPQFNEPRIHFAVNCAAQSCPPIGNFAYSAGNLNTNMEKATKAFINNEKYNKITSGKVVVSKIFDWYKADFGNLIAFLNKYADTKIDPNATIEYMDYDWGLNDK